MICKLLHIDQITSLVTMKKAIDLRKSAKKKNEEYFEKKSQKSLEKMTEKYNYDIYISQL